MTALALACAVTAACSGAGGAPGSQPPPSHAASSPTSAGADQPLPPAATSSGSGAQPIVTAPADSVCVSQVLGRLTLAQQVGQLFLVGVTGDVRGQELAAAVGFYH